MTTASTTDRAEASEARRRAARNTALRYAIMYTVVAVLWVVLSDRALTWLDLPEDVELTLASIKGVAFVLVTALLLLALGLRYFRSLEASRERYTRLFENAAEGLAIFRVVRDAYGRVADLVLVDINPKQVERAGVEKRQAVGKRLRRPRGLDRRMRSYFEVVANAAASDEPARSELHLEDEDAYELLEAYPIGRDRWALSVLDVSATRRAELALRRQEEEIRRAYVDVLDAVTGGTLILLTEDQLGEQLGTPLMEAGRIAQARDLAAARATISAAATRRFPAWVPNTDVRSPVGEALVNALRHAGGGSYQLFARDETLQIMVRDDGPGIDFRTLPRATLQRGFSTAASLGMGFTIMLQGCERVLLSTRPGRTSVVLEFVDGASSRGDLGLEVDEEL